ncbi:MAG: glycosyltransferase family 4 protein [Eubacterium sp.]|nr:glycosyltransferase family 4 protein [Eubacterium sp.]
MIFLLFGTGDYYNRYRKWFVNEKVAVLLDNDPEKQNTSIDGIKVLSPEEGVQLPYDVIVILSFYYAAMKRQLLELGVEETKIYHFYDLHRLFRIQAYDPPIAMEHAGKKILLLSQDMTLGGPAIALFQAAKIMKKYGRSVIYASMLEGPLHSRIEEAGIPVVVDENLQIGTMQDCGWTQEFSLVICNTVNFHVFLSERDTDIPVIWWLHDAVFYYDGVDKELLRRIDRRNLQIVSVGPIPREAIQTYLPDLEVGQLLYGVADLCRDGRKHTAAEKMVFVTIGYVTEHKGQDILLRAIRKLSEDEREQAEFYLVGQDSTWMAQQLKQEFSELNNVIFMGTVGREQIDRILGAADVLVVPSRQDSMPTVAAEAMMHYVPCLLSDAVGTAQYIEDEIDGLLFSSEDVDGLAERIHWCIENRDRISVMGKCARRIYEKFFSVEVFEEKLLDLIQGI